ncbi:ribonuclease Z [Catalinimonas alkaloidigena]|uniref:ribonuclease Z n=1 Tax=Catalinimonas alkaloidigena TaxID=1075417 RepID=UPI002405BC1D|nr:ribonuclease Z [Catalinimonas alkaloidigena]MDF9794855.1 ribonuclease Z [Catalinimonas alkaloidigena]
MAFQLKILGANSATPAYGRHQSSQLLNLENHFMLIDCGEGAQMQLLKYKAKVSRINHIFISHLHGDHVFGLIGLLNTLNLTGRTEDLYIYGPYQLSEMVTVQMRATHANLKFKIHFSVTDHLQSQVLYENPLFTVHSLPLDHGIACSGFLFREKEKPRRIDKEKLKPDISVADILDLKEGKNLYDADGSLRYANEALTLPPKKSRSYAYCSDTRYQEKLIEYIEGVDLLYHEATFMHDEAKKANERYHSTTIEAATIAKKANVTHLIIGHYSSRYKTLKPLLEEAKMVFPNTSLALEGEDYFIDDK